MHHTYPRTQSAQCFTLERPRIGSEHAERAAGRPQSSCEQPQQRRFTGPGRTYDRNAFAGVNPQINIADRAQTPGVDKADPGKLDAHEILTYYAVT